VLEVCGEDVEPGGLREALDGVEGELFCEGVP
jgi:hypothetical protein